MKKLATIAFILFNLSMMHAQHPAPLGLRLDHLALSVKDVDHAADFYGGILKLQEITNKTQVEGIRWFSLGEGKELHLISTLKDPVTINKAVHFALTVDDFDLLLEILHAHQIPYSDWPGTPNAVSTRADGIRQVFFQDPDGYWIEVNSVGSK
jgi:catechol 2,3-dioxygenase-like lactoylglutathione lyase family enzyme